MQHLKARRLRHLSSHGHRDGLAQGIDALLAAADGPSSRRRVLPHRESLRANSGELRDLAKQLRSSRSLNPRAIAALQHVLTDGTGPVYTGDARALARRIARVSQELTRPSTNPAQGAAEFGQAA